MLERMETAAELVARGWTYSQIITDLCKQFTIKSPAARRSLKACLEYWSQQSGPTFLDDQRMIALKQRMRILRALWDEVVPPKGDELAPRDKARYYELALECLNSASALLGLEAPQRIEAAVMSGDLSTWLASQKVVEVEAEVVEPPPLQEKPSDGQRQDEQ